MASATDTRSFHGWRVVSATFVLAVFGWGFGFYGPPVYLQTLHETRGWSLSMLSSVVTCHFLFGALVVANINSLYLRYGIASVTKGGALALAAGTAGWTLASDPWQLFVATLFSGAGWAATGAAAVNAIVSPWFARLRPAALATAYNGASVGGVIFSPLWVMAIAHFGFAKAAAIIGVIMIVCIWLLSDGYFARTPQQMGLHADDEPSCAGREPTTAPDCPQPAARLWTDRRFLTLTASMALGLFAQIGLLAHLFSLLVPILGASLAATATGGATAAAIVGRSLVGWLMPAHGDRRIIACVSYGVQIAGCMSLLIGGDSNIALLIVGVVLFGAGIGNATSLPPLIAQTEFAGTEVSRVVPLMVATGQAAYAFAPLAFGLVRDFAPAMNTIPAVRAPWLFVIAALIELFAIAALLAGRGRSLPVTSSRDHARRH